MGTQYQLKSDQNITEQRQHYDRYFSSSLSEEHLQDDLKDRFLDAAIAKMQIQPDDAVLEVGCGNGIMTAKLLGTPARLTAIDLSPKGIAQIEGRFQQEIADERLRCEAAEINDFLARHPASFDRICGGGILHHLSDLDAAFRLMAASLRPGGRLLFGPEPNATGVYGLAWRYLAAPLYRIMGGNFDWEVEKGTLNITISNLSGLLTKHGLSEIELYPYQVLPHFGVRILGDLDYGLISKPSLAPVAIYLTVSARLPTQ